MSIEIEPFGDLSRRFTITNANGLSCSLISYGATLVSLRAPDRDRTFENIILGLDTHEAYVRDPNYLGSTVGRFANRIGDSAFSIDGIRYEVPVNEPPNHLHGGPDGFHQKIWEAEVLDEHSVQFRCVSPDGEGGYPGTMAAMVTYVLNDRNELAMNYEASADAPTLVNMTSHAYWNLAGAGNGNVLRHEARFDADAYLEVDEGLIPTGQEVPVDGGPLDFREWRPIGDRHREAPLAAKWERGYDHCLVIRRGDGSSPAAEVYEPRSGRFMEVRTTQPTFMFYSGNNLDGVRGADNRTYDQYGGLCLEMQGYPDAPNHPDFPSAILRPGETYREQTTYRFGFR